MLGRSSDESDFFFRGNRHKDPTDKEEKPAEMSFILLVREKMERRNAFESLFSLG